LASKIRQTLLALVLAAAAASLASADTVRTRVGIGYSGKIVSMDATGLVLQSSAGKRTVPLGEIAAIQVEGYPELETADKAYDEGTKGGSGAKAAFAEAQRQYELLMGRPIPDWMRVLIRSRLVRLYSDSGRAREALDAYLGLAQGYPDLVAGISLPRPQRGADAENKALLGRVEDGLKAAGTKPYALELERLRVALVVEVGTPEQKLSLIRQALKSSNARTRAWARIQMLDLLVNANRAAEAEAQLKEAEPELGAEYAPELAFYRGRVLAMEDKNVDAAIELMRLPILYPAKDRAMTAESLFRAGQAMEAAGLPKDEVKKVYQEAVKDYAGTSGAQQARLALARLGI